MGNIYNYLNSYISVKKGYKMDPKDRIKELQQELTHAQYLYYVKDAPTMSDFEYDKKYRELVDLETANPDILCHLLQHNELV